MANWKKVIVSGSAAALSSLTLDTGLANAQLANSTISGKSLGTNLSNLTFDNSTLQLNSGTTYGGSAARTISAKTAAIADSGTGLATADQIHTFVTTQTGAMAANTSGQAGTVATIAGLAPNTAPTGTFLLPATAAAQTNITSLGTLTILTVDNVRINGSTIGHTSDTDLMTVASGILTVAGEVSATTLDIGGTNITSTAAELNILDGVTASATDINLIDGITNGTVIASKAIITDANKDITGGRNITISGEVDAATLDISGNADIDGTLVLGDFTDVSKSLADASGSTYTHPSYDGDDISIDTTVLTGATVISDLDFNVTTDTAGHVTDANASVGTRALTLANLGYTGATDANNYVLPTNLAGDDFSVDTGVLTGATVVSDIDINVTTDASGHVTDTNGSVSTRTLTLANLGYTGETDATADQTAIEIMALLNSDLGGDVNIGNQTSDSVTFGGPVVVTGNLTVNGTTTTVDTTNLNVTDQFITLNDTGNAADGGIVVEGAGTALGWDESESRWGIEHDGAEEGDTALDPDAYISCVVTSADTNYQKNGNIRVESGEIYIYVE